MCIDETVLKMALPVLAFGEHVQIRSTDLSG